MNENRWRMILQQCVDSEAYDRGYAEGLHDGALFAPEDRDADDWWIARRLARPAQAGGYTADELTAIFGTADLDTIILGNTPERVISKLAGFEAEGGRKIRHPARMDPASRFLLISVLDALRDGGVTLENIIAEVVFYTKQAS